MALTKNQKAGIVIGIVVIVLTVGLLLILRKKKSTAGPAPEPGPLPANPQGGGVGNVNTPGAFPLGAGSRGDLVAALQTKFNEVIALMDAKGVNNYGLKKLSVDGNWGPKTDNAFRQITALAGQQLTSVASQAQFNSIINQANNYINVLNTMPDNNDSGWNIFPW